MIFMAGFTWAILCSMWHWPWSLDGIHSAGLIWSVQEGITHMSRLCQGLEGWAHLGASLLQADSGPVHEVCPAAWSDFLDGSSGSRRTRWKLPVFLKTRPRTGIASILPYSSIGQNSHRPAQIQGEKK